jgi:hypothetical protein
MLRRSALKWWLLAAILITISSVVLRIWVDMAWRTDDAKTSALKQTYQLLTAAGSHPVGDLPKNDLPAYLWVGEKCWTRLQSAMTKNSNQYAAEIAYDSNDIPDYLGNRSEVGVTVKFADGDSILVDYYQGGLLGCR